MKTLGMVVFGWLQGAAGSVDWPEPAFVPWIAADGWADWLGLGLCGLGISGALAVLLLNPALLLVSALLARGRRAARSAAPGIRSVSLIIVGRGGGPLWRAKLENSIGLRFPAEGAEVVMLSDGPDGEASAVFETCADGRLVAGCTARRAGKNYTLNEAVRRSRGEILVFSDMDALLSADALDHLLRPFADPDVGGVCGQRVVADARGELDEAQKEYIRFDSAIKAWESRLGSITSNDGKLYAIRRELFRDVPDGVTDDLFTALTVVKQGRRFVFEPGARVRIAAPARDLWHEIERRRRIVCRSLTGVFLNSDLLNPLRHGAFGLRLAVNKVLRRMLPVSMILMLLGSALMASGRGVLAAALLFGQAALLVTALGGFVCCRTGGKLGLVGRLSGMAAYFFAGNIGTLIGGLDYLMGRRYVEWEPRKSDAGRAGKRVRAAAEFAAVTLLVLSSVSCATSPGPEEGLAGLIYSRAANGRGREQPGLLDGGEADAPPAADVFAASGPAAPLEYRVCPGDVLEIAFFRKPAGPNPEAYRLQCGDVLEIHAGGESLMSAEVPVRPDGFISFFNVPEIPARGRTIDEMRALISARMRETTANSDVTVFLAKPHAAVEQFLETLNGNVTSGSARTVRAKADGKVLLPLVGEVAVTGKSLRELAAEVEGLYDAVFPGGLSVTANMVSTGLGNLAVLGEVRRPGLYTVYGPVSALEAVAMAGGVLDSARLENAVLVRRGAGGEAVRLSACRGPAGKADPAQVLILPNDIVVVPKSAIANLNLFVKQCIYDVLPFRTVFGIHYRLLP